MEYNNDPKCLDCGGDKRVYCVSCDVKRLRTELEQTKEINAYLKDRLLRYEHKLSFDGACEALESGGE